MKTIKLLKLDNFDSMDVLQKIVGNSPVRGISVEEMRRRVRILDALDRCDGERVTLEDADYEVLKRATEEFPFAVANRNLLDVLDAILTPEAVDN